MNGGIAFGLPFSGGFLPGRAFASGVGGTFFLDFVFDLLGADLAFMGGVMGADAGGIPPGGMGILGAIANSSRSLMFA